MLVRANTSRYEQGSVNGIGTGGRWVNEARGESAGATVGDDGIPRGTCPVLTVEGVDKEDIALACEVLVRRIGRYLLGGQALSCTPSQYTNIHVDMSDQPPTPSLVIGERKSTSIHVHAYLRHMEHVNKANVVPVVHNTT